MAYRNDSADESFECKICRRNVNIEPEEHFYRDFFCSSCGRGPMCYDCVDTHSDKHRKHNKGHKYINVAKPSRHRGTKDDGQYTLKLEWVLLEDIYERKNKDTNNIETIEVDPSQPDTVKQALAAGYKSAQKDSGYSNAVKNKPVELKYKDTNTTKPTITANNPQTAVEDEWKTQGTYNNIDDPNYKKQMLTLKTSNKPTKTEYTK